MTSYAHQHWGFDYQLLRAQDYLASFGPGHNLRHVHRGIAAEPFRLKSLL